MSSESKQAPNGDKKGFSKAPEAEKSRLAFEPTQTRKKPVKKNPPASPSKSDKKSSSAPTGKQAKADASDFAGIPEVVSKRMVRRMAFFSGIPTSLGMLTFIVSYIVVSQHLAKLPNVAVLLVSLGFFGLGVLGLSYGALSTSWDEDRVGTWFGWNEFKVNFGRTIDSWRSARQKPS
jgi:VIT1/CCC1 family predicted Fe2+/Mn2+ transporter